MSLNDRTHHARGKAQQFGEAGQALIETAISLTMLIIMLIGAVEVGRIAWAAIQVTNAAKAAVQYGDYTLEDSDDIQGMKNAAADESPYLPNLTTDVTTSCICADTNACLPLSSGATNLCPKSATIGVLDVTTQTTFDPLIRLPGLPSTYTLHGKAVQQVLNGGF